MNVQPAKKKPKTEPKLPKKSESRRKSTTATSRASHIPPTNMPSMASGIPPPGPYYNPPNLFSSMYSQQQQQQLPRAGSNQGGASRLPPSRWNHGSQPPGMIPQPQGFIYPSYAVPTGMMAQGMQQFPWAQNLSGQMMSYDAQAAYAQREMYARSMYAGGDPRLYQQRVGPALDGSGATAGEAPSGARNIPPVNNPPFQNEQN